MAWTQRGGVGKCSPAGDGVAAPRDGHYVLSRYHRVVFALKHTVPGLSHFDRLLCTLCGKWEQGGWKPEFCQPLWNSVPGEGTLSLDVNLVLNSPEQCWGEAG